VPAQDLAGPRRRWPFRDVTPSPWFPAGSRYDLSRLYALRRRRIVGGAAFPVRAGAFGGGEVRFRSYSREL